MRKGYLCGLVLMLTSVVSWGQADQPHYTMFMYNKMLFNAAYAGSRDVTSVQASYRYQWAGISGAPRNISVMIDGPVGSYMQSFRHNALGASATNEQLGVVNNTGLNAYYAYRIQTGTSVLSFGVNAGVSLYNARYSDLNLFQGGGQDRVLSSDVRNAALPNGGVGIYWSGARHYIGLSIPAFFQNYYDKSQRNFSNGDVARQTRSYYATAGYTINLSENVKLLPQAIGRWAANSRHLSPLSADANLSVILYDRLLLGATYRTDNSMSAIAHMQVFRMLNIGYSYDYKFGSYGTQVLGSTHEVTVGLDLVRDLNKYINPRFIKNF